MDYSSHQRRSHHHLQRRVVVFHYIHLLAEMTGFFQVSSGAKLTNDEFTNLGTRKRQKGLHPPNINEQKPNFTWKHHLS